MINPPHIASGLKPRGQDSSGFTLMEIAVTLAVLGLLAATAANAYFAMSGSGTKLSTEANLVSLSGAVISFAKANHRLPCPDVAGNGYEGLTAGICPAGTAVGWFPYLSLGLTQPRPAMQAIYGVYRSASVDLTAATERTGDAPGAATYADGADLVRSLASATGQSSVATSIYLTGDNAAAGPENCGTNVASNPAFVILAPGEDRDGNSNGRRVDGIHSALPTTGLCFAAPTRAVDSSFDDHIAATGFYPLIARLNP